MKNRKRVTFTTDADTYAHVNDMLNERGFPQGTLGHYLTHKLGDLELQLQHTDAEQLKLLLDL